jgi:formate/nitrite transporter FocA (FNT family)
MKDWFWKHRVKISYFVGFINFLSGAINVIVGNVVGGLFWIALGGWIIFDAKTYK